jgi:predicted amino acid dehydrogenase
MTVTTGNSYALVLAVQALELAQRERGRSPADSALAVVGATGNIGRAAAEFLAPFYRETILIGRSTPAALRRLQQITARIPRARACTDLDAIGAADAVLVATNAVDAPLQACHFKSGAIVCDLSVPTAIHSQTEALRADLVLIRGGIAALPNGQDLEIPKFPLPAGQAYGCMAEAMLLGFEKVRDQRFTGGIRISQLEKLSGLARKHGMELLASSSRCILDSQMKEACDVVA